MIAITTILAITVAIAILSSLLSPSSSGGGAVAPDEERWNDARGHRLSDEQEVLVAV
jgi:hypothetical protein